MSASTTQAPARPAATAVAPVTPATAIGGLHLTESQCNSALSFTVLASWPLSFSPQQRTVPSASSAHAKSVPAVIAVAPVSGVPLPPVAPPPSDAPLPPAPPGDPGVPLLGEDEQASDASAQIAVEIKTTRPEFPMPIPNP